MHFKIHRLSLREMKRVSALLRGPIVRAMRAGFKQFESLLGDKSDKGGMPGVAAGQPRDQ